MKGRPVRPSCILPPSSFRLHPSSFVSVPETFLILLAGGILLAAAVSGPRSVTLAWLRLAGILAMCMASLSAFFLVRRGGPREAGQMAAVGGTVAAILGQLAFVQVARRGAQRAFAAAGFAVAVAAAVALFPRDG